jgi:hypothetical protein
VQTLEARAELKLTRITLLNTTSALLLYLTGGALGVQRICGNTVNAVLLEPQPAKAHRSVWHNSCAGTFAANVFTFSVRIALTRGHAPLKCQTHEGMR